MIWHRTVQIKLICFDVAPIVEHLLQLLPSKCTSAHFFCDYAQEQTPPQTSHAAGSLHAEERATVSATTDHAISDAGAHLGLVGENRWP